MSFPRCNALFLDFLKFTTNAIPDHIAWKRAKFLSKCFSMLLSYRGKCNGEMANIGQTDWGCGTLVRLDYFLDYLLSHYNFCQVGA